MEWFLLSFDCAQAFHKQLLVQQHLLGGLQMHPCRCNKSTGWQGPVRHKWTEVEQVADAPLL